MERTDEDTLRKEFESHREILLRETKYLLADAQQAGDEPFVRELVNHREFLEKLDFSPDTMEMLDEKNPNDYVDRRIVEDVERRFPAGHKWHKLMVGRVNRGVKRIVDDALRVKAILEREGSKDDAIDICERWQEDYDRGEC